MPKLATVIRPRSETRTKPPGAAPVAAAVAGWLVATAGQPALAGTFAYRCTNPASGAIWSLIVDPERQTVDSLPATITETSISWRELPFGGYFDLDRATGRLKASRASSTGGYFLVYECRLG